MMTLSSFPSRGGSDYLTNYREQNLTTVLRLLKENPPLSRAQLATLTGLNKTTISSLVQELVMLDLVHYTGLDTSGGGRPGNLIEINGQSKSAIGIELGNGFVQAVLLDLTGEILWQGAAPLAASPSIDETLEAMFRLIDRGIAISESFGGAPIGIGVALSGVVDSSRGHVISASYYDWRDVSLGTLIEARTELPVFVDRSANAAAIGEEFFGLARQSEHFVFVLLGHTLSSGLYLNRSIYRGFTGSAGEFERPKDSLPILLGDLLNDSGAPRTVTALEEAVAAGEPEVLRLVALYLQTIVEHVNALNTLLNPELIVVGGRLRVITSALLPALRDALAASATTASVQVEESALGAYSVPSGAATLAVKSFLANLRRSR